MKFHNKKYNQNNKFKPVKIDGIRKNKINLSKTFKKFILLFLITIIFAIISTIIILLNLNKKTPNNLINFDYSNYDKDIIAEEIFERAEMNLTKEEAFFINGIIRKNKPTKCLEIGVGKGGTSILILNSIKDIKNSFLVSLDINKKLKDDPSKKIGYRVEKYFSNISQKWQLYTGDMPHIFLEKLNLKFNFVIIDSSHIMPEDILNIIELLPFLEEEAIIILPNLISHMKKGNNTEIDKTIIKTPTSILLMSALVGKKKIICNKNKIMGNIGVIFLEKNQEKYYENYFLLLINVWDNMLSDEQIFQLRLFIKKYYKKEKYINILDNALFFNKKYKNI